MSKYQEFDAALIGHIRAGRNRMSALDAQSDLHKLATPHCDSRTPAWRIIDRRLQALRKAGAIAHDGKVWAVAERGA